MKKKTSRLPLSKSLPLISLAGLVGTPAFAATWTGAVSSDWTTSGNWSADQPVYGTTAAARLEITNATGNGAVYDPAAQSAGNATTTFNVGRGLLISGAAASLTINSGTIAIGGPSGSTNAPVMANAANAALTINGGTLDVTANPNAFNLVLNGSSTAITSTLTLNGGSFVGGTFNLFVNNNGTLGSSAVNLNGGTFAVTQITRSSAVAAQTSVINFNGGTLQARVSSATFLGGGLTSTTSVVQAGGAKIDSQAFDITVGQALTHDGTLGATRDGGLVKTGSGTLTLSGANTFTGVTAVNAGAVSVTGTIVNAGAAGITVANSASLALSGTLNLTSSLATIANAGTFTAGGTLNLNGLFDTIAPGGSYALITGSGTKSGNFIVTGYGPGTATYNGATGVLSFTAVPEPSAYGLAGAGALAAVALIRRRRRAA